MEKLRASPISAAIRSANIRQVLWPRALHGCEAVQLGDHHLQKLKAATKKAMKWDRAGASALVRLCLLHKELDPGWYQLWKVVQTFRTQIAGNRILMDWWKKFSLGIHIDTSHGPFGKLQALLTDIGLGINEEFELSFSENLLTCSDSTLREVLIKHYHRSICSKVITRNGFSGLEGFDEALTTSNDHSISAAQVEQLMIIRGGSFFANHTKNKWDASTSAMCPWCNIQDTKLHRYTECARYDDRARHGALFGIWDDLPQCFQARGLVPENPWWSLTMEALTSLPSRLKDFQFRPSGSTMHAFTDRTCSRPESPSTSLAAWY